MVNVFAFLIVKGRRMERKARLKRARDFPEMCRGLPESLPGVLLKPARIFRAVAPTLVPKERQT